VECWSGEDTAVSIAIREALTKDVETLYRIEQECFTREAFTKGYIAHLLQRTDSISLIAEVEGKTVGFAIALIRTKRNKKVGHIFTVDVTPKTRKRGIGLRLLTELERALKGRGTTKSYLEVRVDNTAARELYRKLGYAEIGRLKDYYGLDKDGIVMKKTL
jgi:ribosomal-protein-alanine acetyltransferase